MTAVAEDVFTTIKKKINALIAESTEPRIAAFDADGTLWNTDIGEAFFDYQIHNCNLAGLPTDPWTHYHDLKKIDLEKAYYWLAQINLNHPLTEVRTWAQDCIDSISPLPIFEPVRDLIKFFQDAEFEIYIVTASITWSVEPAAKVLGIKPENVLGFQTRVVAGRVTDQYDGIATFRKGKREALLQRTQGAAPIFAAGNTMGDFALLESAKFKLAISSQAPGHENYSTEQELAREAQERGWFTKRLAT